MKLIERYVYAVTERLPEDIREDVSQELRANIEDMLSENPTESEIRGVLEKLGNPKELAQEYNPTKRYLIGPSLYEDYFAVLRLVTGIVAVVLVCITLLEWIFNFPVEGNMIQHTIQFFVEISATAIQGVIQGALWVTIVFAILERSGVNAGDIPFFKKKWSLEDLPENPLTNKSKISRGETIFSIMGTVIFTTLFYFNPEMIAIYYKGSNGPMEITQLFMIERLHAYIVIILLFAFFQLSINIWKFISKNWNIPLAIANALLNTLSCIFVILLLRDKELFNPEFIAKINDLIGQLSFPEVSIWWNGSLLIFAIIFIVISSWDSISGFLKCSKQ